MKTYQNSRKNHEQLKQFKGKNGASWAWMVSESLWLSLKGSIAIKLGPSFNWDKIGDHIIEGK